LLKYIEEFGKYTEITGFRNVKIEDAKEFLKRIHKEKLSNVETQFFDAKFVASWEHLYFAVLNALTAFKNKENISKSVTMETLLYASSQRQIRKAMELLGIKSETSEIALLIIGQNPETVKSALPIISASVDVQHDDTVLELSEEKRRIIQKAFGISDLELKTVMKKDGLEKALINLVIEQMALLATRR
jgi:tRNA threonylcarbamoyladenosine modification (KEOPS) complex Cgi121 subunit